MLLRAERKSSKLKGRRDADLPNLGNSEKLNSTPRPNQGPCMHQEKNEDNQKAEFI